MNANFAWTIYHKMTLSWKDKAKYYSYLIARPPPSSLGYIVDESIEQKPSEKDETDISIQMQQGSIKVLLHSLLIDILITKIMRLNRMYQNYCTDKFLLIFKKKRKTLSLAKKNIMLLMDLQTSFHTLIPTMFHYLLFLSVF